MRFPNLTPSRIVALACRKRFKAEHIDRSVPRAGFSIPLAYGTLVHEVLKRTFDPASPVPPAKRDIEAYARRASLEQGYPSSELREDEAARCARSVRAYAEADLDAEATLAVEQFDTVSVRCGPGTSLTLGVKLDRLLVRPSAPDHLVVRDYKTGACGGVDAAAACLMLAVVKMKRQEFAGFSLEFDHVNEAGLNRRHVVSVADAKEVWPELKEKALRVYGATEFPAEPGEHCTYCPLRATCQPDTITTMDEIALAFA